MNGDTLIDALGLPTNSRVGQRIPKKLLLENGAPTIADKRIINDGVEELQWLAALKPSTIGVPEYRDNTREYLEIDVLRLTMRATKKVTRLVELVHRAVPYPLLLITDSGGRPGISAAHKRWSLGETGKTVLEDDVITVEWDAELDGQPWSAFHDALALGKQPRTSLYSLYQSWLDTLLALQAARATGTFAIASNAERAALRREALQECARLDAEISRLRAIAAKENQMSRRVELNLELKRVEAAQAVARINL
jgi:hypothetical protein